MQRLASLLSWLSLTTALCTASCDRPDEQALDEAGCDADELNMLLRTCLDYGGDFAGMGSAEGSTECVLDADGSVSGLGVDGTCTLFARAECAIECLNPTGIPSEATTAATPPSAPPKIAFVTSERWTGALGGIAGATEKCNAAAERNPELAGRDFLPWLSSPGFSPAEDFKRSASGYILTNGTMIAESWEDLEDGLDHPLSITETGEPLSPAPTATFDGYEVWSGTRSNGEPAPGESNCSAWAFEHVGVRIGDASLASERWSDRGTGTVCRLEFPIYCFEQ